MSDETEYKDIVSQIKEAQEKMNALLIRAGSVGIWVEVGVTEVNMLNSPKPVELLNVTLMKVLK